MPQSKARPLKPAKAGQSSKPTPQRKRQPSGRISAACEACKKRKTKCTGGPPPCQLCDSLGTECIIDLSLDMRRRAALQRTIDESKSYQETLNGLLNCIRVGDPGVVDSLIEYIRSDPTPQDLINAIHNSNRFIPSQDSTSGDLSPDGIVESPFDENFGSMRLHRGSIDSTYSPSTTEGGAGLPTTGLDRGLPASWKGKEKQNHAHILKLLDRLRESADSDAELLLRRLLVTGDVLFAIKGGSDDKHVEESALVDTATPGAKPISVGGGRNSESDGARWQPTSPLETDAHMLFGMELPDTPNGFPTTPLQTGRFNDDGDEQTYTESGTLRPIQTQFSASPLLTQNPASVSVMSPNSMSDYRSFWPSPLGSSVPYVELSGAAQLENSTSNMHDLCVAQEDQSTTLRIPVHLVQPLVVSDKSFYSCIYTNYVQGAKQMLANGVPLSEVIGEYDEVSVDLIFRKRQSNDKFDCASWASECSRSLPESDQYVRLATAVLLTFMMRWLLVPTAENYERLPSMMKPTPAQRLVPHVGAIELCPFPSMRDAMIHRFRDWVAVLRESNWSVNWPFGFNDAIEQDPRTGSTRVTTRFIDHVVNYDNWSVGVNMLDTFPEIAGQIRIHQ